MNRLKAIYIVQGQLIACSGLHIGKGKNTIEIGGMDAPVMKHSYTGKPFIPGSSLKGKMRSLLEWYLGVVTKNEKGQGVPFDGGDNPNTHPISRIFGTTHKKYTAGTTRLIMRDAFLDKDWAELISESGLPYTEEKMETAIDRIKGTALQGSLRQIERVVPGAKFKIELLYRVYDLEDNGAMDEENFNLLKRGLALMEMDALGGMGSRGSGKIAFEGWKLEKHQFTEENGNIVEEITSEEFILEIPQKKQVA